MTFIGSALLGTAVILLQSPLFFELLRRILARGIIEGALVALGGFAAYLTVLLIFFFGTYKIIGFESVQFILYLIGGLILTSIGIAALRMKEKDVYKPKHKMTKGHPTVVGFSLAISSPIDIAVWVSVGLTYLGRFPSRFLGFINVIFFALSVVIIFFGLASLIYLARRKISTKHILWISKLFGLIILSYGLYFLFKFLKILVVY